MLLPAFSVSVQCCCLSLTSFEFSFFFESFPCFSLEGFVCVVLFQKQIRVIALTFRFFSLIYPPQKKSSRLCILMLPNQWFSSRDPSSYSPGPIIPMSSFYWTLLCLKAFFAQNDFSKFPEIINLIWTLSFYLCFWEYSLPLRCFLCSKNQVIWRQCCK